MIRAKKGGANEPQGIDDLQSPVDLKSVIVFDFGSYCTKVGYSGNDQPKFMFPTCVASSQDQNDADASATKM
jgi:actin-related protein